MAVRFNSSLDYYRTTLNLGAQTVYSFCCWVKISSDRNTWVTALNLHSGASNNSATFESSSNGTTWEFLTDNGGDLPMVAAAVGEWYFLAASVNGSSVNCYVKPLGGAISNTASTTQSELDVDAVEFWLGEWPDGGQWLNGCLTGVRLWLGAALTQTEFDDESAQLMPVRTANLTAAYPLEEAETTDYSGNGFTLVTNGDPVTEAGPAGIIFGGTQTITGTAAVSLGAPSVAATGQRTTFGTSATTLGALSVHVSGPAVPGVATVLLGALSVTALGTIDQPPPGQVFDLSRVHLTLPTEDPGDGDAQQINQPELATYEDEHFFTTPEGRMRFVAPVVGATTSGASGATRSELRAREANYDLEAFDPHTTGRRQVTLTTRVDASNISGGSNPRKEAIFFQIHGAGDSPIPLILSAEYHVATPRVRIFKNGPGLTNPVTGITPTTDITVRCRVENATVRLWVIAGLHTDLPPVGDPAPFEWPISDFTDDVGWYYKPGGIYNKTTIASGSTGESSAEVSFLEILQPGDPDPEGHVEGTAAVSLGALSVAAFGLRKSVGSVGVSLGGLQVAAVGGRTVLGQVAVALGALQASAAGTVIPEVVTGSAALPLGALSVTALGTRTTWGDAGVILGALQIVAIGPTTVTATASVSLGELSVTATGTVIAEVVTGTAAIALAGPTILAVGSRVTFGSAAVTLPGLVAVVLGEVVRQSIRAGTPIAVLGPVAGTVTKTPGLVAGTIRKTPGLVADTPIAR